MTERATRRPVVAAGCLYITGLAAMAVVELRPGVAAPDWIAGGVAGFAVALGVLVARRAPQSPAGAGLVLLGAAPTAVSALEAWARSAPLDQALPAAAAVARVAAGAWVFNLAGFVVLASTFPSGRLPGRRWAALPWAFVLTGVYVGLVVAFLPDQYEVNGGSIPGHPPFELPDAVTVVALLSGAAALVVVLTMAVAAVAARARVGDAVVRAQLRWFVLGAASVPVLLVGGWIAEAFGASIEVAYTPFMLAVLVLLPAAVTIGVLRYDLFDIDRLLSGTISGVLTTVVAARVFTAVVTVAAHTGSARLGVGEPGGLAAASFVTALALQPLHRRLHARVGRIVDRDRAVTLHEVRRFADDVRDGRAEPEHVEEALRRCLDDPDLEVLLAVPGHDGLLRLDGSRAERTDALGAEHMVSLQWHDRPVGALVLGRVSKCRVRRAREAVVECRLAIGVSRLRLELRQALDDARASRLRLVEAAAIERRRLERDLHDGAQQQLIAVGMRLRSVQRRHTAGRAAAADLDIAVGSLETTVADLRRLAHGMRPALLDDGLAVALARLAADVPVPVRMEVADDGAGGARAGHGLSSLADRVAAIGGRLSLHSEPGCGTTLLAIL